MPLDINNAVDRPHVVSLDEGCTPCRPYDHPLALKLGCRLEMKDEGKHYPGFGRNPTLSFKDRGMTMTVAMARSLGISRLAVPTQGNAGDSLAEYAVAAGIEAVVVMAPETDMPVLGKVAAYAACTLKTSSSRSSPERLSTVASECAKNMFPGVISTWRRSRNPAGVPKERKRWVSRWPSRQEMDWRKADGRCRMSSSTRPAGVRASSGWRRRLTSLKLWD